jgi:hypothetical protein
VTATACEGRYALERLWTGGPDEAVYVSGSTLVSVGPPTGLSPAELAERLALGFDGVTELVEVCRVDGAEKDAVVEALPAGAPVDGPTPHAVALGLATGRVLKAAHAAGAALGGIRPDAVWAVDGELTAIAPRAALLWSLRARADAGIVPGHAIAFLSPERIRGGPPSPSDDVFALAATVAFWATGAYPYAGETRDARILATAAGDRRPWTADPRLGALIDRALGDRDLDALLAGLAGCA